ncbi:MAG TPA: PEP/pyruvate-binding domain-containing protein, partial [Candidatus Saccharimonadales bacterium]|nr:PEP/pyruvate-binding domain-containing protein [Candidatus Saccharimonadales bacterium]
MASTPTSSKAKTLPRATTLPAPSPAGPATKPPLPSKAPHRFVKWFADIGIEDVPLVGGKNASLGEMFRELMGKGVKVPEGFAITAEAYRHFLREAGLEAKIRDMLRGLDTRDMENLRQRGSQIRHAILAAQLPH